MTDRETTIPVAARVLETDLGGGYAGQRRFITVLKAPEQEPVRIMVGDTLTIHKGSARIVVRVLASTGYDIGDIELRLQVVAAEGPYAT